MAAVAVLLPQDAFHQSPALKPRRRLYPVSPSTNTPAAASGGRRSPNSKRRKGSPTKKDAAPVNPKPRSTPKPSPADAATTVSPSPSNLVMGQVKILKRGEALLAPVPEKVNPIPMAVDVLVSHKSLEKTPVKAPLVSHKSLEKTPAKAPMVSRKHLKFQYAFAGSAAATSPEPSALPLPSFCGKKDPTSQLRKLLGLDLGLVL